MQRFGKSGHPAVPFGIDPHDLNTQILLGAGTAEKTVTVDYRRYGKNRRLCLQP